MPTLGKKIWNCSFLFSCVHQHGTVSICCSSLKKTISSCDWQQYFVFLILEWYHILVWFGLVLSETWSFRFLQDKGTFTPSNVVSFLMKGNDKGYFYTKCVQWNVWRNIKITFWILFGWLSDVMLVLYRPKSWLEVGEVGLLSIRSYSYTRAVLYRTC